MEEFLVLPKNYQEQLINCELEFQNELNETNIRKLLYLYTLGMQHYNITGKKDFEKYYKTKLNNLLLNESVINYLDTHKVDLTKKVDLNLFNIKKKDSNISGWTNTSGSETQNSNNNNNSDQKSFDDIEIKKKPSFNIMHKKSKIKKEDILEYVTRKIKEVDIKLNTIDKQVSNNIVEQMSSFESIKRSKKIKKSKNEENNDNDTQKLDNIISESDLDLNNYTLKRRGSSIGQNRQMKEIEEYVQKNMKEMYQAIEELKESYEAEIKEAVDNGFDEIADSLREDLKAEEEGLVSQYEEERMKQIELIREKYKKPGS
jgi:hypothetical protein